MKSISMSLRGTTEELVQADFVMEAETGRVLKNRFHPGGNHITASQWPVGLHTMKVLVVRPKQAAELD